MGGEFICATSSLFTMSQKAIIYLQASPQKYICEVIRAKDTQILLADSFSDLLEQMVDIDFTVIATLPAPEYRNPECITLLPLLRGDFARFVQDYEIARALR